MKLGYEALDLVQESTVAIDRHSTVHSLCVLQHKLSSRCYSGPLVIRIKIIYCTEQSVNLLLQHTDYCPA